MSGKVKLLAVFGTRPEAVKMGPLLAELRRRAVFDTRVCVTGQHREMLDPVLRAFGVTADHDLDVMRRGQSLFDVTEAVLRGMENVLDQERPDMVLVYGDTATAFAGALASFYKKVPVAHVEAGLRTYDLSRPWPEEMYRRAVTAMSAVHFAPTGEARDNLLREGVDPARVYVTGNTAIDALAVTVKKDYVNPVLDWAAGSRLVLVTAHRRENLGAPLEGMLRAIRRAAEERPDVKVLYPVHLNPAVGRTAHAVLDGCARIRLTGPLEPAEFANIMARSWLVLTDSGGLQEEAPSLDVPVLVMRDKTERPEGVAAGTLRLAGTAEESVYAALTSLLDDPAAREAMARAVNPYGDGHASERIAGGLEKYFETRR